MNLTVSGRHFEVTAPIRDYVQHKMERITRHFDHVIDLNVILSVEKSTQKAEVEAHLRGKDIFVAVEDSDMYAAIDALADKLDRQILRHKEKMVEPRHSDTPIKHRSAE